MDTTATEASTKAVPSGQMVAPKTAAPELERLKPWAGRWTVAERYEPSEWMPKGGEGKGWSVVRIGPGGIVIEDYDSGGAPPMGAFTGFSVLTWDAKASEYRSHWFDSMDPKGMMTRGKWQGDELVLEGEATNKDGKRESYRMRYGAIKAGTRLFVMERSIEGGPMKKAFTVTYRKSEST